MIISGVLTNIIIDWCKVLSENIRPTPEIVVGIVKLIVVDNQINQLSEMDINLIMENGIKGKYGPLYNRFDANVFFTWADQYMKERQEILNLPSLSKNNYEKPKQKKSTLPDNIRQSLISQGFLNKEKEQIKKEWKKEIDNSEHSPVMSWYRLFDKYFDKAWPDMQKEWGGTQDDLKSKCYDAVYKEYSKNCGQKNDSPDLEKFENILNVFFKENN